jgi:hypothetical protein
MLNEYDELVNLLPNNTLQTTDDCYFSEILSNGESLNVVDLGCGIGVTFILFTSINPNIDWIGIDIDNSYEAINRLIDIPILISGNYNNYHQFILSAGIWLVCQQVTLFANVETYAPIVEVYVQFNGGGNLYSHACLTNVNITTHSPWIVVNTSGILQLINNQNINFYINVTYTNNISTIYGNNIYTITRLA